jgi:ArsR family metal-binding transcriptional regulator
VVSPSQRPLPDSTQHSQQTNSNASSGIRTHNLSRRAAEDLRLRPRDHWNRPSHKLHIEIFDVHNIVNETNDGRCEWTDYSFDEISDKLGGKGVI